VTGTTEIASALLALAFAWAALAKLSSPRRWRRSLAVHDLPPRFGAAVAIATPAAELATAALIAGVGARIGAALALALLSVFTLALLRARSIAGDRLPCGCFGTSGERDWRAMIARNVLLGALAVYAIAAGGDLALTGVEAPSPGQLAAAALTAAGLALAVWTAGSVRSALRR
jgi:uncharacterized membrane protein YphA (DoxX/SURF4 family)